MVAEFFVTRFKDKGPLVERRNIGDIAEPFSETVAITSLHQNLFGSAARKEVFDILKRSLGYFESTCGDIEEGNTPTLSLKCDRSQIIVLILLENRIVVGNSRGDKLGNTAFDELFGEFRILQLVANRYFIARLHQFGKITLQSMMRHPCHFDKFALTAGAPRQHDTQHFTRSNGILTESLIEITHPVKEQRSGVLRLDLIKLPEQRSSRFLLFHSAQKYQLSPEKSIFISRIRHR